MVTALLALFFQTSPEVVDHLVESGPEVLSAPVTRHGRRSVDVNDTFGLSDTLLFGEDHVDRRGALFVLRQTRAECLRSCKYFARYVAVSFGDADSHVLTPCCAGRLELRRTPNLRRRSFANHPLEQRLERVGGRVP